MPSSRRTGFERVVRHPISTCWFVRVRRNLQPKDKAVGYHATTTTDRVGGISARHVGARDTLETQKGRELAGEESQTTPSCFRIGTPRPRAAALPPRPPTGRLPGRGLSAARLRPIVSARRRRPRQNIFAFSQIRLEGENI
jgi:hypothetical protein